MSTAQEVIAFHNGQRLARGSLADVAVIIAQQADRPEFEGQQVLVFDARSSKPVDLDIRGSESEIRQRYATSEAEAVPPKSRGRGRPKLGVVGKEVTLLPRHWEWLARQPGGASVALRKLIEKARKEADPRDSIRTAQDTTYNFMYAVGGDLQGFEEASRALYGGDRRRFDFETELWPADIRAHLHELSEEAFTVSG